MENGITASDSDGNEPECIIKHANLIKNSIFPGCTCTLHDLGLACTHYKKKQ